MLGNLAIVSRLLVPLGHFDNILTAGFIRAVLLSCIVSPDPGLSTHGARGTDFKIYVCIRSTILSIGLDARKGSFGQLEQVRSYLLFIYFGYTSLVN